MGIVIVALTRLGGWGPFSFCYQFMEFCHLMVEAVIVIRRCAVQYWAHWCEHHCVHDTRCNSWTTSQQAYFLPESRVYLP